MSHPAARCCPPSRRTQRYRPAAAGLDRECVVRRREARHVDPHPVREPATGDRSGERSHRHPPRRPRSGRAGAPARGPSACPPGNGRPATAARSPASSSRRRLTTIVSWAGGPNRYAQDASTKCPISVSTSRWKVPRGGSSSCSSATPTGTSWSVYRLTRRRTASAVGAIVGDVRDHAADPFVDEPHGGRREDPAEVVVGGLRSTEIVDHAVARAGDEVAEPQDQAAAAGRAGAAPLAEDVRHDLAGDGARQLEVAIPVVASKVHGSTPNTRAR